MRNLAPGREPKPYMFSSASLRVRSSTSIEYDSTRESSKRIRRSFIFAMARRASPTVQLAGTRSPNRFEGRGSDAHAARPSTFVSVAGDCWGPERTQEDTFDSRKARARMRRELRHRPHTDAKKARKMCGSESGIGMLRVTIRVTRHHHHARP